MREIKGKSVHPTRAIGFRKQLCQDVITFRCDGITVEQRYTRMQFRTIMKYTSGVKGDLRHQAADHEISTHLALDARFPLRQQYRESAVVVQ